MANYQILYWYDIPIQVRATDDNGRVGLPLPDRFQTAIDRAAMEVGLTGSDAYTDLFHWSKSQERPGTAQSVAEAIVSELREKYQIIDPHKTASSIKNDR